MKIYPKLRYKSKKARDNIWIIFIVDSSTSESSLLVKLIKYIFVIFFMHLIILLAHVIDCDSLFF